MTRNDAAGPSTWSDPDEAPELDADWFRQAEIREGGRLVRRGRPPSGVAKKQVTIRLDPDVLDALRARGAGWQTLANAALRRFLELDAPVGKAKRPSS
jgi:uncharacterized protein (DUF4415 family)